MLLSAEVSKQDSSYDFCLASWAKHLVDTREVDTYDGGNETTLKRSEVIATILSGLGPQKSRSADEEKG